MKTNRKKAREYLNEASLTDFWTVVREAKISDADQKILDARFVRGLAVFEIAQEFFVSEETVKATIKKAYDKVSKLI